MHAAGAIPDSDLQLSVSHFEPSSIPAAGLSTRTDNETCAALVF